MSHLNKTIIILVLLTTLANAADFSGWNKLEKRWLTGNDSKGVIDLYNNFRGIYRNDLNDRLFLTASLDLRYYDRSRVTQISDLSSAGRLSPLDITVWEAFADVYGFLLPNLDVRIGRQRINWGTADKLNPTDNLNPDDFSDPFDFGAKVPVTALKATYYLGDYDLQLIYQPEMQPAWLPRGDYGNLLSSFFKSPLPEVPLIPEAMNVATPTPGLDNSIGAVKFSGFLAGYDFSVSYYRGYEDLPLLSGVSVPAGEDSVAASSVHANLQFEFPRQSVLGADLAGELLGVGIWAEGGLFFPESRQIVTTIPGLPVLVTEYDDSPYLKYTLGVDYTFGKLGYLNTQWMHGYFTERGSDNLHDYLFARWEREWFNSQLKLTLGGAWESEGFFKSNAGSGFGFIPEIQFHFVDNLEIAVGSYILEGGKQTLLGSWKTFDQGFVKVKVSF